MRKTQTKKLSLQKKASAIVAVLLVAALLLGGTFAWKEFGQSMINRFRGSADNDVLLHDDFTPDKNKDVYVENTGENDVIVRVRLDEYLQIGNEPLVGGAADNTDTWHTHTYDQDEVIDCGEVSHRYYQWVMSGSSKVYKPGTGEIADKVYNVGDPFPDGTFATETLPTNAPITMEEFLANRATIYDLEETGRWILDTDGWAYWSRLLEPDQATNLLLDNVLPLEKPDDNYYYAINVVLQATNKTESYEFDLDKNGDRDITDDAEALVNELANSKNTITAEIDSIAITTPPTKTTYTVGESFSKNGMVVTATMSDGSTKTIKNYTVSPASFNEEGEIEVTITTPNGKTATLTVTVNAAPTVEPLTLLETETNTVLNVPLFNEWGETTFTIFDADYPMSNIVATPNAETTVDIVKVNVTHASGTVDIDLNPGQYTNAITVADGQLTVSFAPTYSVYETVLDGFSFNDDFDKFVFHITVTFTQGEQTSDEYVIHMDILNSTIS